ncbi:PucR family transcriptional regulator [Wenjunlia tyrosinilytica]|uniref:PucR family transcriptional regulator n=1 Tax=Wenjunlia tyrosinilytica TaxID=1544741 RepID=UPI002246990E|nr:PucR family transcriptional regulator [Wenjunlia tyrosinilytica]
MAGEPGTAGPASGPAPAGGTGRLTLGVSVRQVLKAPCLEGARVVAGGHGLDRVVQRLNVMEVPDILPWTKPHELLLTTGYPLRDSPQALADLVDGLEQAHVAALAVKFGRYIDEPPPKMLAAADRHGLPLIRLPDDVAFDDILNQVLPDILDRHASVLSRSEEVHRALVNLVLAGGSLAELTGELTALLGGTVMVTTPDGRVLARSDPPDGPPPPPGCFDASGRFLVERYKHGPRALEEPHERIVLVPILAGSLDHGRVVLITDGRQPDDSDVHLLERGAATGALVITKELAVAAVESKYQGDFLRDLLAGRAGGPERTVPHCASLGWDIDRPMVVVVAELESGPDGQLRDLRPAHERFATAWTMVVRERDSTAAVVGYSQEVVVVMGVRPGRPPGEMVQQMTAKVSGDGGGGRRAFSTGLSRVITDPSLLPEAYEQARRAAKVGRQMHGPGAVADFDSLGVFRLLSLVPDSAELTGFMRATLRELATRDDPETDDLRTTLQVLLDTNLNVAETARILHFHYNTLRYRIGKLERLLGPFTTDPHLRLNVEVALQVIRMRGL